MDVVTRLKHRDKAPHPQALQRRERKVTGLKLHKIVWYNNKLKAKISWDPLLNTDKQPKRYYIHWMSIKCNNTFNENKELSAVTEQTSFEIYELDYQCKYKVHVNRSWKTKNPDSEVVVTIPDCEYFQKKVNGTNLNC